MKTIKGQLLLSALDSIVLAILSAGYSFDCLMHNDPILTIVFGLGAMANIYNAIYRWDLQKNIISNLSS